MNRSLTTPRELEALLSSLDGIGPKRLTSCPGWTSHHLAAHIAGNYEEVLAHVQAFADHRPLERTRTWEEREQPLRELELTTLLTRIDELATATTRIERACSMDSLTLNSLGRSERFASRVF